jgi:hypothetical protein
MTENQQPTTAVDVVPPSAVHAIQRAEIDVQIATAKQYPRSLQRFQENALVMVTGDEETAESCIYKRPVGKQNGKPVFAEGKSIRMAEIVGASYGNLRVGAMIEEQTDRWVKARGVAHDLETNFFSSSEVIESTVDRNGRPYSERMRVVVAKAALAKARRDATFQVVPAALCKPLEKAARETAFGNADTLDSRRAKVMAWIGKLGIDKGRVFAALGIEGEADIGLPELETLTGIKTAIRDGDTTVDEAFPQPELKKPEAKSGNGKAKTPKKPKARKPKAEPEQPNTDAMLKTLRDLAEIIGTEQYLECRREVGIDDAEAEAMLPMDVLRKLETELRKHA